MAHNQVQVTLHADTNLPEDVVVNSWSFLTTTAKDVAAADLIIAQLVNLYQDIETFLSSHLNGNMTIRFYDRADVSPRIPWYEVQRVITPGATQLPREVALVVSFQAAMASGLPAARRRGRIYLGPLANNAADAATGRPAAAFTNAVVAAFDGLLTANNTAVDWQWEIWSEADQAGREVVSGWVDNSWDTQRRRGVASTARDVFLP